MFNCGISQENDKIINMHCVLKNDFSACYIWQSDTLAANCQSLKTLALNMQFVKL